MQLPSLHCPSLSPPSDMLTRHMICMTYACSKIAPLLQQQQHEDELSSADWACPGPLASWLGKTRPINLSKLVHALAILLPRTNGILHLAMLAICLFFFALLAVRLKSITRECLRCLVPEVRFAYSTLTSLMLLVSVSSMVRRSMPIPHPAVGGRPYSREVIKPSSTYMASSSPCALACKQ